MRFPYVINKNTRTVYTPSPACFQLLGEKDRTLFPEDLDWQDGDCSALVTHCVQAISKNFEKHQLLNNLPGEQRDHLLETLSTKLPLELMVPLVDDEIYWQRRYNDAFGVVMQRLNLGWTWKQVFMEKHVQTLVEQAQPQYEDEVTLKDMFILCSHYIKRLLVNELQAWKPPLTMEKEDIPEFYPQDHVDFTKILQHLYNVDELDIIYGMDRVGDTYNSHMFKLSVNDCHRLGRAVLKLEKITILRLHRCRIGDDKTQALMHGLIRNETLVELDLSNCGIGDGGALSIAHVMLHHPNLSVLILANNLIKQAGAEGFGFALLEPACCPLTRLDLRLNPLRHEGVMGILRALVRGTTLKELSIAGCIFGDDTPIRVGQMINLNQTLEILDVSSNWFGEAGGQVVVNGLMNNRILKWLDVRETDMEDNQFNLIKKLLLRNRNGKEELEDEEAISEEIIADYGDNQSEAREDEEENAGEEKK